MRYKIVLFTSIVVCIGALSCNQSKRHIEGQLREFIGTEIIIPESLFLFNNENNPINRDAKYKIVSYIDSLSCTSCYLNNSTMVWADLLNSFKNQDFSLFMIFYTQDIEGIRRLFESYNLDVPFFIDFYGEFKDSNKIPIETMFHTFLLRDNTVILVGDPSNNPKLLRLYEQEIIKQ